MTTVLEARDLAKGFRGLLVLRRVSLRIDAGDLTAVVGWFVLNHRHAPTLSGSSRAQLFPESLE